MGTANKVYKRNRVKKFKWGRVVIFVFAFAYIIMFVYTFFAQRIDGKVNITYGNLEVKETVTGYITRNEKIISADIMGDIYPLVQEQERVSKGERVAIIRNENSDYIEEKIKDIKNKLNAIPVPIAFSNDIKLLDGEVDGLLATLMKGNYNENFSTLTFTRNKIEDKLSKKALIIGEAGAKGTAENGYYEELKKYEDQLMTTREELTAPIAGTVAYRLDGYENVFSYNAIGNYDAITLGGLNVPPGELVGTTNSNSFKIVDNIEGYITVISNSNEALNAVVDKRVQLRFPEISDDEITGKIEYVTIENGEAVITFRINRKIEELINYRKLKVDIIWNSKEGMIIPATAIKREEDGECKIFVITGKRAIPKIVDVVLEFDGQAIIKSSSGYDVILYDSIAKDAKNVSANKMIISK